MTPPRLRAYVYTPDFVTLRGELEEVSDTIRFQDEAGDTGSFSLFVPLGEPYLDTKTVRINDVIRIDLDTTPVWAGVVDRIRYDQITDGIEGWTLSGPGVLAKWATAVVYPAGGEGRALFSDHRTWNFASPELDDSAWPLAVATEKATVGTNFGLPELWIDPDAYWIWDRAVAGGIPGDSAPAGDCYFRGQMTKATYGYVELWAAADDSFEAWVDGIQVLTDPGYYRGNVARAKFALDAGEHKIAIRGTNQNAAKAGVLLSVVEVDSGGVYGDVIARTDASWSCLAYPTYDPMDPGSDPKPPGFEPTRILRILLQEAQLRGCLDGMFVDFDDDLDSDGATVDEIPEFTCSVGDTLYTVIRQMGELCLDFGMTPDALTLHAWVKDTAGGDVGSVTFGDQTGDPEVDNVRRLIHDISQVGAIEGSGS